MTFEKMCFYQEVRKMQNIFCIYFHFALSFQDKEHFNDTAIFLHARPIAWAWDQPETDGSPGLPFKNTERIAHVEKYDT